MSERNTRMIYTGTSRWIKVSENGDILEERQVDEFERPVGRNEKFMITYLAEIINLIDNLGNKQMQVVKYILEHMQKADNTLIITTRELAEKSGVGHNTVLETLKTLENSGLIERRTGALMLKPKLMNNWKAPKEATMMVKYNEFSKENQDDGENEASADS